jgi:SAM-dependent methyltransferase
MKNRDDRTTIEINSHMAKATAAANLGMVFTLDEYCCLICNAYFRKEIFQSDLNVIKDLINYFKSVGSINHSLILKEILDTTNNLKDGVGKLYLEKEFQQVLPDDLKLKLRSLHNEKPSKESLLHGDEDFFSKFSRDLDSEWIRCVQRFNQLKLKKNSRILDIGCGFGIFSYIAELNGHKVDSIDMPNASPILKKAAKILNIKKLTFTVMKNKPLLRLKNKYDVVSAFRIHFNGHATKNLWDVNEWKYFLLDLHDNVLNDNGIVTLVFNGEHDKLKPIIIDGEHIFLGKKSLEEFFKPFFVTISGIAKMENKMFAILTKKNIKVSCNTNLFKKRSFTIEASVSKYGF